MRNLLVVALMAAIIQTFLFMAGEVWMLHQPLTGHMDTDMTNPPWYQKEDCTVTFNKGNFACRW